MNDAGYARLVELLDGADLTPDAVDFVLAAADGADALAAALGGAGPEQPREHTAVDAPEPAHVFLQEIVVEGFRGVGPAARLPFAPGPGLSLVVGRNGSGKSSFAEGLELLLTGTTLRWAERTKVWREGWRNMHHDGRATVLARFRADGEPQVLE